MKPAKGSASLFGRIALARRLVSQEQLDECLELQAADPERRLGEIMVEKGFLTDKQVFHIVRLQQTQLGSATRRPGKEALAFGLNLGDSFSEWSIKREIESDSFSAAFEVSRGHESGRLRILDLDESVRCGESMRSAAQKLKDLSGRPRALPRIFDFGESEGRAWVVTEWFGGGDLDSLARRQPLPDEAAISILESLCEALALAHSAGVVHYSLHPRRLLYRNNGELVISDFAIEPAGLHGLEDSRSRALMFRAPEQLAPGPVGLATDIYGLGALAWFMLAGQPPFSGTAEAAFESIRKGQPPWLRERQPRASPGLEALCAKAMSFDVKERYEGAEALRADLEKLRLGQPITAKGRPSASGLNWLRRFLA